jgi:hypothetical protein
MKMVRGHAEARWMPSRHNFALFRLYAYLRLRNAAHEPNEMILAVDRHQSSAEAMAVATWIFVTTTCCLAGTMFSWPVAFLVAAVGIHAVMVASGVLFVTLFPAHVLRINSIWMMTLFAALAAYCATRPTWVRFAGWQFFALLALNAIAAMILFFLRDSVARLESSCAQ